MRRKVIENIIEQIESNDSFLISAHVNPDGDSLGAQLALYHTLKQRRKRARISNSSGVPAVYRFLPGSACVTDSVKEEEKFDVIFVLDCSSISRTGQIESRLKKTSAAVINIDHHPDNACFGDINWVDARASSVGEMLFYILKAAGIKLGKKTADCLYTAILTDTGSFQYANVTARTYHAAAELMACGIKPQELASKIYQRRSSASVRLLGYVLSTLQVSGRGRLCRIKATPDMFRKARAGAQDTEGFVNYPRAIRGAKVSVLFCQDRTDGEIKVNFRSKGKIDVGKIARRFGGGGHYAASGARLTGDMDEAEEKVLKEIRKYL